MIRYLKHQEIDKESWDACILCSPGRRVYAYSWYLDFVCPGWDALVADDYRMVFPLTHNRKWGIGYLYQPFFAQQLGLFSIDPVTAGDLAAFLKAIPSRFRFIEIHLNAMINIGPGYGEIITRLNHELDISGTYAEIAGKYSQNTRRNLRKASEMKVVPATRVTVEELISLFRRNFGDSEGKLGDRHYRLLTRLISYCILSGSGNIAGARNASGVLSAAAFFLRDGDSVYYLFAGSAPEARDNGAMFALVDRFLSENAGKYMVLDFEGGNDPGVGRFYKSFGAKEISYPAIRINRLPWLLKGACNVLRKIRQRENR